LQDRFLGFTTIKIPRRPSVGVNPNSFGTKSTNEGKLGGSVRYKLSPMCRIAHLVDAEVYTPAIRRYGGLPELAYPFHDRVIHVTNCGRICLHRKKINLSTVFAGQALGIKEVEEGIWLVSFMEYDLGYIDLEEKTLQPLDNPFGPKGVNYVFGTFCKGSLRTVHRVYGAGDGNRTDPNEPNKGVTTHSAVQLESNGVKLR
jgi:hypothetical protein